MKIECGFGRAIAVVAVLMASLLVVPTRAAAQVGAGWSALLGCWVPVAVDEFSPVPASPESVLCVVPGADATSAMLVTIVDGSIVERQVLDASGARQDFERDGCSGWARMEWSSDGRRLYQESEYECPGPFQRRATGILAIVPGGDWLDVQGVSAREYTDVRIIRHRPIRDPATVNAEVAQALQGRSMQIDGARVAAASPVDIEDVIDATRAVAPAVVEGWLMEQGQGFALNAERLLALADGNLPDGVIDMMVALSNPNVFAINLSAREADFRPDPPVALAAPISSSRISDPWFDRYDRYGYGYGYDYGYGSGFYPRYRAPVIVIRDADDAPPSSSPARLINGRGYTRGGTPSASPPSNSRGGSDSGSSTSTGSTSSSGSSGSSTSTPARTAKPRS
jgi:hypothetical protein